MENNGFKHYSKAEIQNCQIDGLENIPDRGMNIFSRRAILNVAMLLKDSPVAKIICSVLLDATENKTVVKEKALYQYLAKEIFLWRIIL